mmetsp:Transcript_6124/g.9434  ORF Transcript_6124/g.9434 Transcript_6124/m.9434 type:complete len:312 (+) Transcript_6124:76-1011(+)|eukprot:CAMPEP_0184657042 /NCGR_PEP_ID=MMETSP0308-20130426/16933_1 /TAXON_ID=38269 /ORGANISM="Gloeochaete witrockiana, Strain SAG 46.84" /LENGTH=311 /DNA_ID=CAMNT_0027094423 /DNA_START=42 /DNA_END=977 /DNA_ORIENTATION=-
MMGFSHMSSNKIVSAPLFIGLFFGALISSIGWAVIERPHSQNCNENILSKSSIVGVTPKSEDLKVVLSKAIAVGDLTIEPLLAERNFRPDWSGKGKLDFEDRKVLLPFLLGDRIDTKTYKRRVYVDLGAGLSWEHSLAWHLTNNPVDFDEYYLVESRGKTHVPAPSRLGRTLIKHDWRVERYLKPLKKSGSARQIGSRIKNKIQTFTSVVALKDNPKKNEIDISKFLLEKVRINEPGTFVCVKMELEGAEWDIIPAWEQSGLIDHITELFVEIHYGDGGIEHWSKFSQKRKDASEMLQRLRQRGVFAHYWA